jgi:hypothetical protein
LCERRQLRQVHDIKGAVITAYIRRTETTLNSTQAVDCSQQYDERTALLTQHHKEGNESTTDEAWLTEMKALWKLAKPNWVALLLEYSIGGITTITAGRLGTREMNAASLAQITITTLCLGPLIYGMCAGEGNFP